MRSEQTIPRACYTCGTRDNPLIAREPIEVRFGRPLLPEGEYRFARCRRCSLLYVDSSVDDAFLADIYANETIDVGQGGLTEAEAREHVAALRVPEFRRHWTLLRTARAPRPGDRLLDFGCQLGDFGAIAADDGVQPYGVELSKPYADASAERFGGAEYVFCGLLDDAPFQPRSFQYVTAFETLEHMCDPRTVLRRLGTLLHEDGVLAFSVPASDYFHFKYWMLAESPLAGALRKGFARRSAFYRNQVLPHTHIYNFSRQAARLLVESAGLEVVGMDVTGWHGRWAPVSAVATRLVDVASRGGRDFAPSIVVTARVPRTARPG